MISKDDVRHMMSCCMGWFCTEIDDDDDDDDDDPIYDDDDVDDDDDQ